MNVPKETDDGVYMAKKNFAALIANWKELPAQPWEGYKDPGPYEIRGSPSQTNAGPTMSEWVKTVPDYGHSPSFYQHYPGDKHRSWDNWTGSSPQIAATA